MYRMNTIYGALCLSLAAAAPLQIARCDGAPSNTVQVIAADAALTKAPRSGWPVTLEPVHRAKVDGVPNFGKLNNMIWRSGQPSRQGYELLAKQGLKTVVNLRQEFPQDENLTPPGVRYVYIPIKDEHEPTEEQARKFIEVASNPDNWPLLVHCHAGEGRAGVMSALVRCSLDKWDQGKVMQETGNFRLSHLGFIRVPMAACQQRFIQQWYDKNSGDGPAHQAIINSTKPTP